MDNRNITLTIDEIHEIRYQNYEVIKNKLSHTIYVKDNSTWYGQEMSNGEIPESYEVWQVPEYTWAVFKCVGAMPQATEEMWKRIYSEWLPQAKYEVLQSVSTQVIYQSTQSSPGDTSEIWLQVKKK